MKIVVWAVALLLLGSAVLFIKAALFNRRPQKFGLILAIITIPLYMIYYNDVWPFIEVLMRPIADPDDVTKILEPTVNLLSPLDTIINRGSRLAEGAAGSDFKSDASPALLIGFLLLVRVTILQRVAVRLRLQRVHDPIANFFAGAAVVTLVSAILVSTFSWGWTGALVLGGISTLVYLGALALLASLLEVIIEISKLISVWLRRKIFALATRITRIASWISSLGGRLVSRDLIEKIREDTSKQESIYLDEQETQDQRLEDAYVRDRRRRSAQRRKSGRKLGAADADLEAQSAPAPAQGGASPAEHDQSTSEPTH